MMRIMSTHRDDAEVDLPGMMQMSSYRFAKRRYLYEYDPLDITWRVVALLPVWSTHSCSRRHKAPLNKPIGPESLV